MPFVKVDKSLFIISCSNMLRIKEYMDAWRRKVEYNIFEVLLTPEQARLLKKNDVMN